MGLSNRRRTSCRATSQRAVSPSAAAARTESCDDGHPRRTDERQTTAPPITTQHGEPELTRTEYHRLDAPSLGGSAEVAVHGHWGRPVIWFPSEGGAPWDFEANGMLDAVRPAIDDGRITVFCVPSFDSRSWSASWMPLGDRARNHRRYEDWIIWQVVPFIRDQCGGRDDIATAGPSMGAFHAVLFALRHPHVFGRAVGLLRQLRPVELARPGVRPTTTPTSPTRCSSCPAPTAVTWTTCGRGLRLTLVVGSGMWEDSTGANGSTRALAGVLADKQIPHELYRLGSRVAARLAELAGAGRDLPARRWAERPDPSTLPSDVGRRRCEPAGADEDHCMTAPRRDSTTHLIGLLLGTENDWPAAFETLTRRLDPISYRGVAAPRRHRADHHRAVRPARPGPARRGHRPAGLVVLPPAGVAEEGRAGQRHLPAQQPVHLPGDGEALRVLRDDPARLRHPGHRAGAVQEPGRPREVGLHGGDLQPAVRPGRGGRPGSATRCS